MTQEEIQKQIEAVRGLIALYDSMQTDIEVAQYLDTFEDNLRTLTQTLKPYLNGEELEV